MVEAPFRTFFLGADKWELTADHRAWYTLEMLTKRSFRRCIRRFCKARNTQLQPGYLLLWALTSRHREKNRISFVRTEQDRETGTLVPLSFVQILPTQVDEWSDLKFLVLSILEEAKLLKFVPLEEAEKQDAGTAPGEAALPLDSGTSPSTGSKDSGQPSKSSSSRRKRSGTAR